MTTSYVPAFESQTDQRAPTPWTNCTLAAGAMLLDHWTYGARRSDDITLRTASGIPLNRGVNFAGLAAALRRVTGLELRYSEPDGSGNANATWANLRDHLGAGGGAAVAGDYARLAGLVSLDGLAVTRWQPGGRFGHAVFVADYRPDDGSVLWMDPLGRGTYAGDRVRLATLWEFIYKSTWADASARVAAAHAFAGPRPAPPPARPTREERLAAEVLELRAAFPAEAARWHQWTGLVPNFTGELTREARLSAEVLHLREQLRHHCGGPHG